MSDSWVAMLRTRAWEFCSVVGEDGEVDSSLADRHMAGARAAALGARGVVEGSLVAARGVHGEDTPVQVADTLHMDMPVDSLVTGWEGEGHMDLLAEHKDHEVAEHRGRVVVGRRGRVVVGHMDPLAAHMGHAEALHKGLVAEHIEDKLAGASQVDSPEEGKMLEVEVRSLEVGILGRSLEDTSAFNEKKRTTTSANKANKGLPGLPICSPFVFVFFCSIVSCSFSVGRFETCPFAVRFPRLSATKCSRCCSARPLLRLLIHAPRALSASVCVCVRSPAQRSSGCAAKKEKSRE